MNTPTFQSMCVKMRGFCWQVGRKEQITCSKCSPSTEPSLAVAHPLPPFVPSWSGLLHTRMEPQRRPPAQDHPVTPPRCQRPDPECRLLLQAGRQNRSAWPANGRQTRPLLFPLQRRLPGHRGYAPSSLRGKKDKIFSVKFIWAILPIKRSIFFFLQFGQSNFW